MIKMLSNSFIFLPRIGKRSEKKLWNNGIKNWNDFTSANSIQGLGKKAKYCYDRILNRANLALKQDDHYFFTSLLPQNQTWRCFPHFDEVCYLDIETSGYYGDITVIGIYDGFDTKILVKGINLDEKLLKNELKKYKTIVTFNGSSFDLPVIKKRYGNLFENMIHIDLRHACSQVGLKGGLKKIEKTLNINRLDDVEGIDGGEAVYLWQMWRSTGERKYLNTLVKYNEEDIINLKPLMKHVYALLKAENLGQV